jgi:hypothetical protein
VEGNRRKNHQHKQKSSPAHGMHYNFAR